MKRQRQEKNPTERERGGGAEDIKYRTPPLKGPLHPKIHLSTQKTTPGQKKERQKERANLYKVNT